MRKIASIVPILAFVFLFGCLQISEAVVTITGDALTVTPAAPGPRAEATIGLIDTVLLEGGSSVRWFVDGIEMTENQDDASITITTKGTAETTEVEARIMRPGRGETTSRASIAPARLDLIVGSESSVPYFFKGRALPGKESRISVQAFLFGDNSGPYRYRWNINGREEVSEVGGTSNQIIFKPNLAAEVNVYVEVTDRSGAVVAQGGVVVPLIDPEVYFYEANPLHGLIPIVLSSPYYFLNDEITLHAEPFYFSGPSSAFDIKWQVDRRRVASDQNPLELSLVKTQEAGQALIGLSIINTNNYVETAANELLLTY